MELIDLKEGDKIYNLVYWHNNFMGTSKRELRTVTVKKVHKNKAILKGGYRWTITKKMFNDEWFATKNECYGKALNHHESELSIQKENVKIFKKEVKYLENKLLELE